MSETRTYEIVTSTGKRRITIPDTYKVTYGPVIGAAGKAAYGGNTLRVWETKDLQRGLWADVVSFRDISIVVEVLAVRRYGDEDDHWLIDDGTFKDSEVQRKWMSVDDVHEPAPSEPDDADDNGLPHAFMPARKNRSF